MPRIMKQRPTVNGPTATVPSESAWDLVDRVRLLVYGQSGTGKTTFWSTFPGPILALLCSGGNKPGELRSIDTPENRKKIHPVVISSSDQYYHELANSARYETIVLDHASGFSDMLLQEIMKWDKMPAQKPLIGDNRRTWGEVARLGKEAFLALLNVPHKHVVFVAQERTFGESDGNSDVMQAMVGPALTPALAGWLTPACDYVVQTFKRARYEMKTTTVAGKEVVQRQRAGGVEFCLRCEQHDVYQTKFREPSRGKHLPDVLVDPTYGKIQEVLQQSCNG